MTDAMPDLNTDHEDKEFAPEYREETEEVPLEDVTGGFIEHRTLDITYFTPGGTKTVRAHKARQPVSNSYVDVPAGFHTFYHEDKQYAYSPDERRLITVNDTYNRTVAEEADLYKIKRVEFPDRAVVVGAADSGVEATIYYRSPQSDAMQSVTVEVRRIEGRTTAHRVDGTEVGSGRRIEAHTSLERDIVSKHGTTERPLGKVARVEFPRGHRFTVEVEGLDDSKGGEAGEQRLEERIADVFRYADGVSVHHEGRLEWD